MLYSRIFFLMRRRPPRSTRTYTLFPYTTLFRSLEQSVAARRLEIILALGRRAGDQFDLPRVEPEPGISGLRRSEEHTSELQSLMRISYAVFCLKKKKSSTIKQKEKLIKNQYTIITRNTAQTQQYNRSEITT